MAQVRANTTAQVVFQLEGKAAPSGYEEAVLKVTNKVLTEQTAIRDFLQVCVDFGKLYDAFYVKLNALDKQTTLKVAEVQELRKAQVAVNNSIALMEIKFKAIPTSAPNHAEHSRNLEANKLSQAKISAHTLRIVKRLTEENKSMIEAADKIRASQSQKTSAPLTAAYAQKPKQPSENPPTDAKNTNVAYKFQG